jgi:hypothetical protein
LSFTLWEPVTDPELVYAYLDPISGSVILQAVIAAVVGAAVTMKRAGITLRDALAKVFRRDKK